MNLDLKAEWYELASKYSSNNELIESCWNEIKNKYSRKKRYYHNLEHIESILLQANQFKTEMGNFDAVLFSIWYHDITYNATRKDNEEKSAEFAARRLKDFNIESGLIQTIKTLILSTKKHQIALHDNEDNAFLLDFDLSILGADWETYKTYTEQIRNEYKIYPDFLYNRGKKEVLEHFIEKDELYFTDYYKNEFENKARENIIREIVLL